MELFDYITTTCTSVLKKKSFVCIMGIDNIENLHSWAENTHQNQKDTRSIHTYIVHVLYLYQL